MTHLEWLSLPHGELWCCLGAIEGSAALAHFRLYLAIQAEKQCWYTIPLYITPTPSWLPYYPKILPQEPHGQWYVFLEPHHTLLHLIRLRFWTPHERLSRLARRLGMNCGIAFRVKLRLPIKALYRTTEAPDMLRITDFPNASESNQIEYWTENYPQVVLGVLLIFGGLQL